MTPLSLAFLKILALVAPLALLAVTGRIYPDRLLVRVMLLPAITTLGILFAPAMLAVGKINGDERDDIVTPNDSSQSNSISLFLSNEDPSVGAGDPRRPTRQKGDCQTLSLRSDSLGQ